MRNTCALCFALVACGPATDGAVLADAGLDLAVVASQDGATPSDATPPADTTDLGLPDARPDPDAQPAPPAFDWSDDWLALTEGVHRLELGDAQPDMHVVHGDRAFPVVTDEAHRPFVSAARVGVGRVFHAAHESLLTRPPDGEDDANRLLRNAIAWLLPPDGPRVLAVEEDLREALIAATEGMDLEIRPLDLAATDGVGLVGLTTYAELDPAETRRLHAFIAAGGGLLSGGHAWWWASQTGRNAPTDFPGNRLLAPAGIVLAGTGEISAGTDLVADAPPGPECHAARALDLMRAFLAGRDVPFDTQVTAANTASNAIRVLPLSFDDYFEDARAFVDAVEPVVPTKDAPIRPGEHPVERLVVTLESKLAKESPPDELPILRAAADFPGAVPDDAPRVTRTVTVDGSYAGRSAQFAFSNAGAPVWRSTGLYAAPGEVFTVVVPAHARGRLDILIGAHTDTLWRRDTWERAPDITRVWPADAARNRVASSFGGPISIRVPPGATTGPIEITIEGAVEMPRYVRGETTAEAWATLRDAPAPWAELACDGMILTVPSSVVRDLDPGPLLDFWQEVMDAANTLAGIDDHPRAERFVTDRQISAGWMHSGYPLMAHLESTRDFIDVDFLRAEGSWGPFHEIGHNYQWVDWVLPGTTEATCNLWSVYIYEQVVGRHRDMTHGAIAPAQRAERLASYLAGGADFVDWSVWTALETYLQLQEAFGWDYLTDLFVEYRDLDDAQRPRDDAARIDDWVVRSARRAGMNLGPFYLAWGLPASPEALDSIADLPAWPEDPMVDR